MGLSSMWSRYFAGETSLDGMQQRLHALVLKSGEVRFIRRGEYNFSDPKTARWQRRTFTLFLRTLGDTKTLMFEANPLASIACICSQLRLGREYDITAINDLPVLDPSSPLLNFCFEDFADDSLTLTLSVLAAQQGRAEDEEAKMKKRARAKSEDEEERRAKVKEAKMMGMESRRRRSEDVESLMEEERVLWKGIVAAYRQEISAPIQLMQDVQVKTDLVVADVMAIQVKTPFLVADVMADPADIIGPTVPDITVPIMDVIKTSEWTLVHLPRVTANFSSGSTTEWRTVACREGVNKDFVCIKCVGHDSNPLSFHLALFAFSVEEEILRSHRANPHQEAVLMPARGATRKGSE